MKVDVQNRDDIQVIVHLFYSKAVKDSIIKHFFNDVMEMNIEHHLPIIISFWDSALFGTATYTGNVMLKHISLHKLSPLKEEHFNRWMELWRTAVQNSYEGVMADQMIDRAEKMKTLMIFKIEQRQQSGFIQ